MMYTCLCMTFNILVLYYIVNETMYYISSKTLLIMLGVRGYHIISFWVIVIEPVVVSEQSMVSLIAWS
jgi:hypothetical protein